VGHIPGQGRAADMNQAGLDSQGRLGSFVEVAGDNTRLVLEAGLKRRLRQLTISVGKRARPTLRRVILPLALGVGHGGSKRRYY
jgi:hypothetical protein